MPEMNGIEATEQALRIRPDLKVIVLSMYGDEQYYYKMVDVGVKGFVLKNSGIEKVIAAIRAVAAGDRKSTRLNSSHRVRSRMPSSA